MRYLGDMRCRRVRCVVLTTIALYSCGDTATADPDASIAQHVPRVVGPVSPSPRYEPLDRCTDNELVRARYPNHSQIISDGVPQNVQYSEADAEQINGASGGVIRMQLRSVLRPASADDWGDSGTTSELGLQIELEAARVQEAAAELLLPIDLAVFVSGSAQQVPFAARPNVPGPGHSPAVLSVLAARYCAACDDTTNFHVTGMLRVIQMARRLTGSAELSFENLSLRYGVNGSMASMSVTTCFDAFIADATDIAACESCGLDAVAEQGVSDCGQQLRMRSEQVTECVREKLASSEAFRVRVQVAGIDSQVVLLWQRSPDGVMRRYTYDSTVCGGPGCFEPGCGPAVSFNVCDEPRLIADEVAANDGSDELIVCGSLYGGANVCRPADR
jgi:hypothetical protein